MHTEINFHPAVRRGDTKSRACKHALSQCASTGLARFRDRHQARDGARALADAAPDRHVSPFACPDCRGWHVEADEVREPATATHVGTAIEPNRAFTASLADRKRRYFLVDIENPTRGAKANCDQVNSFWAVLKQQAPGIAQHDHVVVGASRSVARKYRAAIHGTNVRWIVGANAPDAADNALLAAIDLRRVARDYDELVIISGDHAFADLARRAKASGLSVQVITAQHPENRSMLSRELAEAADIHTVVRLRAHSQHLQAIEAARAMSASWRSRGLESVAA